MGAVFSCSLHVLFFVERITFTPTTTTITTTTKTTAKVKPNRATEGLTKTKTEKAATLSRRTQTRS